MYIGWMYPMLSHRHKAHKIFLDVLAFSAFYSGLPHSLRTAYNLYIELAWIR